MNRVDKGVFSGLYEKNTVLVGGIAAAPLIASVNTLKSSLVLIYAFSLITFVSVILASVIPRKTIYTLRIILYTLIAAIVYVPVRLLSVKIFGSNADILGIYFALLVVNPLIISQSEINLFKLKKSIMAATLLFYIIGFDIAALIFAFIRELLSFGMVNGNMVGISVITEGLSKPYGGFILLGIMSALFKFIKKIADNWREKA